MVSRVRDIGKRLGEVRFSDIVPRDEEAERHALEHLALEGKAVDDDEDIVEMSEEIRTKRDIEGLEDMMAMLNAGDRREAAEGRPRPTMDDVRMMREELRKLCRELGLGTLLQ